MAHREECEPRGQIKPISMTRVIKWCWCRSTSPSWRTTTTMSSTTQHILSDRCWCLYQGSGVLTSIYTLQLSQYEYEATLTIKNVSSVENGFEHFLYMTTRWEPQNPSTYRVIITFIPILVSTPTLQSSFSTTSWMSRYGRNSKEIWLR